MFDAGLWREIFQSINKNRTRSLLSGFTVAFAILLFVFLFGMGNGLNNTFTQGFVDDANNSIFLRTSKTTKAYKGLQAGRKIQFKNKDFTFIKNHFKNKIEYITGRITKNVTASYYNTQDSYVYRAVHPEHQFIEKTQITKGRYINTNDVANKTKVAVIGRLVADDLFNDSHILGEYINLDGILYKVIGVFADAGGDSEERIIYVPISTAQAVYGNTTKLDQINLTYSKTLKANQAVAFGATIERVLKQRFKVAPKDRRGIYVRNFAKSLKKINQMNGVINFVILFIGFGTLMAGIVGVSNIMIFTVKERTKEIGVRKALGAPPSFIIKIILLESILITIIAGYIGLILGSGILKLVGKSLEKYFIKDPSVSQGVVIFATIVLIVAGALAGYFPAKKASKIKPIVALRDE